MKMTNFFPYFSRLRRNPAFLWKLPSNCQKLESNYRHHQKVMNCVIFSTITRIQDFSKFILCGHRESNATYNTITQKFYKPLCTPYTNVRPEDRLTQSSYYLTQSRAKSVVTIRHKINCAYIFIVQFMLLGISEAPCEANV